MVCGNQGLKGYNVDLFLTKSFCILLRLLSRSEKLHRVFQFSSFTDLLVPSFSNACFSNFMNSEFSS